MSSDPPNTAVNPATPSPSTTVGKIETETETTSRSIAHVPYQCAYLKSFYMRCVRKQLHCGGSYDAFQACIATYQK